MTAYEAVRAHELMLNESVSRFEHARLAPLITLNGAAVIAFLTLLGALLGKASGRRPDLLLSGLAVGAWVVGLVAAALAIAAAARQQTAISAAHRLLREALEAALIQHDVARILQGAPPAVEDPPPRPLRNPVKRAVDARERIKNWWRPPDTARPKADRSCERPARLGRCGSRRGGGSAWRCSWPERRSRSPRSCSTIRFPARRGSPPRRRSAAHPPRKHRRSLGSRREGAGRRKASAGAATLARRPSYATAALDEKR